MTIYIIVLLAMLNQVALKGSKMLLALYAIELGAGPFAIGVLIAMYAVFPLVLAVFAGKVSDRYGVRWPMVFGSIGLALGLAAPPLFPGLQTLYLSPIAIGFAWIFFHVSSHNLVGSLGDAGARTRNFGTFSLGAAVSGVIGPLLTGFAVESLGHLATYVCLAIIAAAPGVILLLWPGALPAQPRKKQRPQDQRVLDLLENAALRRTLITSGMILTGIELYTFYVPIFGHSIGLSAPQIGIILGMQAAAAFAVRLWMPALVRRFNEEKILTASLFVAALTYLLFPLFRDATALAAISFVLGLGLGCGQPLSIVLTYNYSPPERAGEALGLRLTVNKLTQIGVPLLFGSLGAAFGLYPVFWSNAALLAAGAYLNARRRPTPDPPHSRT